MFFRSPRPSSPRRRGVTLVEMLVTVALLVLMMTILVQIFQATTGAVSAARTFQELDGSLRQLDGTIRNDLGNLTVKKMVPPLDPKENQGYFEYIENSFADSQGEDTDDCLRFTVKAPQGQAFSGRFYPGGLGLFQNPADTTALPSLAAYTIAKNSNPITIQSEYAEVIYFLRNGNLYRRVLLVAADRQSTFSPYNDANSTKTPTANYVAGVFSPAAPALQTLVSWQGLNDLSAHPIATSTAPNFIILNTLADLTNRENRYASPRFCNDFAHWDPTTSSWVAGPDGVPDDTNADSVPDFWPSLYWNVAAAGLLHEASTPTRVGSSPATVTFPFIYPYAYSQPDPSSALGWIHAPDPSLGVLKIADLMNINHAPLEIGDSLPAPSGATSTQTWWGFPTWRETMSPNWLDPYYYPGTPQGGTTRQAYGLNPFAATQPATKANSSEQLPPMTSALVGTASGKPTGSTTPYRTTPQFFTDGNGADTFAVYTATPGKAPDYLWKQCWEDDLVMTGVRSFDVKAYDPSFPGYVDLGWGDDGRLLLPYNNPPGQVVSPAPVLTAWSPPLLGDNSVTDITKAYGGANYTGTLFVWPPVVKDGSGKLIGGGPTYGGFGPFSVYNKTFAHEGRIPPLVWDNRPDYQAPVKSPNVGDNSTSTVRLRRTWDTWSTDYSHAPGSGVNASSQLPYGTSVGGLPIYPSYPPPYPMALRGVQIQIRAVDPKNERVKVLTIRQDFTDRL